MAQGLVQEALRDRAADLLIILIPMVRKPNASLNSFENRIAEYCRIARDTDTPAVVFSSRCGDDHWTRQAVNNIKKTHGYKMTMHPWCSLGLSSCELPDGQASSQIEFVLTSFEMDPTPCRCAAAVKHVKDWRQEFAKDEAKILRRQRNNQKYLEYILPKVRAAVQQSRPPPTTATSSSGGYPGISESQSGSACFGRLPAPELEGKRLANSQPTGLPESREEPSTSSSSQVCLPTAARERQKAKEKAAKEAGVTEEKKKKKQIV